MYDQIADNKRKTAFLLVGFMLLISGLGYVLSLRYHQPSLLLGTGIFAILYSLWGFFASSGLALAVNGARQIQKQDSPILWRIVENISITTGLPMPKVYTIDDPALNAFATGRDPAHASVAITSGLLQNLDKSELEGVMAHELGHVKNFDTRLGMVTFALVGVVSFIADIFLRMSFWSGMGMRSRDDNDNNKSGGGLLGILSIVALLLAPVIAVLIQLAVSRQREYLADATSAQTTRFPDGLVHALQKIDTYGSKMQRQNTSTAHLFIANPLSKDSLSEAFSTHPPIAKRIQRLRGIDD